MQAGSAHLASFTAVLRCRPSTVPLWARSPCMPRSSASLMSLVPSATASALAPRALASLSNPDKIVYFSVLLLSLSLMFFFCKRVRGLERTKRR